ncbi:MAG: RNA polymerase sigma factor [Microbacteriaceae bacterium]
MKLATKENAISDETTGAPNDESSNTFDLQGLNPEVQAGMEANANEIQIPTSEGWNPAEINTDYRNTGTFEEVFPELFDRIFSHAKYEVHRLGMKADLVEDVVQIAAEKARENWDKYTQGTYALAWFKKIVTNTCYNMRRQDNRRDVNVTYVGDPVEFFDGLGFQSSSAEKQAIEKIRMEELRALFYLLPPDQRDAAISVILDQMTSAEAAAYLGIPQPTLLTRVHRARTRLRGMIGGEHDTDEGM